MNRERSESIEFSRDDLERLVRYLAQSQISGPPFVGKFGDQRVQWMPDGSVHVITTYQQSSFDEIPAPAALPKRKR